MGWNHRPWAAFLYFATDRTVCDLRDRPLTRPHDPDLSVPVASAARPADHLLSHGDMARPRDILAHVGAAPLCQTDQCRGHTGVYRMAPAGFHARKRSSVAPGHRSNADAAWIMEHNFRARSNQLDNHCDTGRSSEDRSSAR